MTKREYLESCKRTPREYLEACAADPSPYMRPIHVALIRIALRKGF